MREAREGGAKDDGEVVAHIADSLEKGDLKFAIEDPDAETSIGRDSGSSGAATR